MLSHSIRNEDGYWINTNVFREEALHFLKYGYYCSDAWGTFGWKQYWEEQLERCINGYTVAGVRITGHHYFYLNFTKIELANFDENSGKIIDKEQSFPHFWDGDYNFFWVKEVAKRGILDIETTTDEERAQYHKVPTEEQATLLLKYYNKLGLEVKVSADYLDGGYHVLVGKSRRKGYSYKNAAIVANTYNTRRNSTCIIGAFDKKYLYPQGTMTMAVNTLNFLNQHTGWAKKRDFVNRADAVKASFERTNDLGFKYEAGYKTMILALTFADNPDAARGKDAKEVLLEEGGKFPNLQASVMATDDTLRAGKFLTGQMTIYGTSGDIDGDSLDIATLFYNPKPFNIFPLYNIWDTDASTTMCAYFHPVNWNKEGFYDKNGNSDLEAAKQSELNHRAMMIKEGGSTTALQQRLQENPLSPSEAFLNISVNNFPVQELRNQLGKVKREGLQTKMGQPGYMLVKDGKATFKPDLSNKLEPIYHYKHNTTNITGCVVVYEAPVPDAPKGTYKIGYDPYRQNVAKDSTSLGAVYVYKTVVLGGYNNNIIVAEYVGRPKEMDIYNRNVMLLAEWYGNAEIMFENEVTSVKSFFEKEKKLHLLAAQPDNLISAIIKSSHVERVYGMHMVEKIKEAGEKYINSWLLTVREVTADGREILQLETIYSIGLLEELIKYNRKGNFDRVIALMFVLFQVEAESISNVSQERKKYMESMKEDLLKLNLTLYS